MIIEPFHKKSKQEGLRHNFLKKKKSEIFRFITLLLEILDKRRIYPWKFHEIVLQPLEILRPKLRTYCMKIQHDIFLFNPGTS